MKVLVIISVVVLALVVLFFWFVLRNKSRDVSKTEPYLYILNADLVTTSEVMLIENTSFTNVKNEFPSEISNSRKIDTTRVKNEKIPIGSTVTFSRAIHYKNSTSGMHAAVLLGKVKMKDSQAVHKIVYIWGRFKTMCINEPCMYWEYEKGFWEN
ncbi:MAG: hypothetical protein JNM57_01770 [Cyclobacteriaceae bacterium]|nr:hypothetical protein [Cyclobacteriaceae bacterium]